MPESSMHFRMAVKIARKKYAFSICIFGQHAFFNMHICTFFVKYMPRFRQINEVCIFCSQPKSKNTCIFPRKNAYFGKILEPSKMHNSMKTLVWPKSTKYEICILCSQPKSKNTCIFPRKNACFFAFRLAAENAYFVDLSKSGHVFYKKGENMHCLMGKCIFLENFGAIKNAY